MTYIKINNMLYPTIAINGFTQDREWDGRSSKLITLEMSIDEAKNLFVNDIEWYIVTDELMPVHEIDPETQMSIVVYKNIVTNYDNSEYSVAGDIIDHRNGTITAKMGIPTQGELLNMLMEGLAL